MKKLLSILICVLLGCTFAHGQTFRTITVNASPSPTAGGTVCVTGGEAVGDRNVSRYYISYKWQVGSQVCSNQSNGYKATTTAKSVEGYTLDLSFLGKYEIASLHAKVDLLATPADGYYFDGWYEGSSPLTTETSHTIEYELSVSGTKNYTAKFGKQSYHRDYAKVVAIYVDKDGKPAYTGDLANPSSIQFTQGGGYVNIGAAATNQTEVSHGNYNTIVTRDASEHKWYYTYYATPAANYKFVGWYDETTLLAQLQANGLKLDLTKPDEPGNENGNDYNKEYTSTCTDAAQAPVAPTMYAVFRPSMTYYYTGPTAYVAMNEPDGGLVYVDKGEVGSIAGVPVASWKTEYVDNAPSPYSQIDNSTYSYVYYAKPNDKYAFKGWATTQYGAPVYGNEYPNDPYTYDYVMSDENTSPENPFITRALYAVFESFYYRTPAAMLASNSQDAGYVYVSLSNEDMPADWKQDEQPVGDLQQVPAHRTEFSYNVYYRARAKKGNDFYGWSSTSDGLNIVSYEPTYVQTYTTQATNREYPHVASPLYAVFRSDIDIRQQDRMIVYTDAEKNRSINDAKVLVDFQKGNTLTASLSGTDASYFTLSNRSGSKSGTQIVFDATQGLIELVLSYRGDLAVAVGKVANITFSNEQLDISRTIAIVVEEAPVISFLPTDGKGEYTIAMTNGSGVNYTIRASDRNNVDVAITHESMSNIEVNLTNDTNDDYYFFGWEMIDGDNRTYISHDKLCTYQFTKSVKVRPEFIPNDRATYFLLAEKDDPNKTIYHDLQRALDDAELNLTLGGEQVVVLNDKDGMGTEVVLPKGTYTIPRGVVLLIPGNNAYTNKAVLDENDYESSSNPKTGELHNSRYYTRLNVEDGTKIIVEGGLNVYARLQINNQTWLGRPWRYGWIELGENCTIDVEPSASINVYGYITGPLSTAITIKNGATVRESFQIRDWHGGSETINYVTGQGTYRVFPSSQFYIQNIEVPLTFESGAKEELMAAVNIGSISVVKAPFVDLQDGLFHLNTGTKLTKYYDKYTDSQVYIMEGTGASTQVELGKIELKDVAVDMPIIGTIKQDISSSDYVLPLPHNMDITVKNTNLLVSYDFAFLAGSKFTIDKTATVSLNGNRSQSANMFVYDRVQNGDYFGTSNSQLIPVGYRPTTTYDTKNDNGILYQRKSEMLQDACLVVDGLLTCGDYGYLYTTNTTNETNQCANITSNGGGKIYVANLGTKSATYQRKMGEWITIPVTPARMRNGDGTYKSPNDEGGTETYTYTQNKWQVGNLSGTHKDPIVVNHIPTFAVDVNPVSDTYVGDVTDVQVSVTPQNDAVDWGNVTWSQVITGVDADQFILDNSNPGVISFAPKSEGKKRATLTITATYTYNTDAYNTAVKYTYTKNVSLEGLAMYLLANTLEFETLNAVYEGQSNITLLKKKNSDGQITIKVENNNAEIRINNNTSNQETTLDYATNNTFDALKKGEVTITITQGADLINKIAATTITKIIEVKDPVQWNWDILYLGEQYDTPITMLDGSTGWTLTETEDEYNIIDFKGTAPNYTASVANLIAGEFDVTFTFTQGGESRPFTSHVIVDPRHLRVDINNDIVFRAVTLSANEDVEYADGQDGMVIFRSTNSEISQWKMGFFGVPDKIYFKPNGNNTWQIEESSNGTNWTTSFPWKYIESNTDFELSLLPSTRYLRISYGAGNTTPASLNGLYITELTDVKADVEKLYMPVQFDAGGNVIPYTKEVVLTYANTSTMYVSTSNDDVFKVKESASAGEPTDVVTIPATSEQNPFGIKGIEVVSTATEEMEGYLEVYEGTTLKLQIPIQTYLFPQELPIKLATDKPDGGDRYYYVTTHTHNAEWDGRDGVRTITLNNAVSDAAPYLIFEFEGNPTYIGFNYSNTAKGTWELEQYIGDSWIVVPHTPANGDVLDNGDVENNIPGTFKRFVNATANKLRLIYQSEYAEKVNITDLVIVGDASAIADPARLELDYNVPEDLTVSAINLPHLNITSTNTNFTVAYNNGTLSSFETTHTLNNTHFAILNGSGMGDIPLQVKWLGSEAIEHGTLELTATVNGVEKLLATVELIGVKQGITDGDLGIYTGVATGYTLAGKYKADGVTLTGKWQGDARREVNIAAAFSPTGTPLFDYVVVYGETTTADGSKTINQPNTLLGSNAKTPCYIYKKNGTEYQYLKTVENANSKEKSWHETSQDDVDAVQIPTGQTSVSMYITGFCPYASTGYTKGDEGVWYFRANAGQSINVYLQDCYIYSRAKTHDGHSFVDRQDGNSFSGAYSCGSGAVLVFACNNKDNKENPMNVTICTLDSNLLKSNYGCFLQSAAGRAFQVSPAVQIRLIDDQYQETTTTHLNFTDEWPASKHVKTGAGKRTNGFLSLQKQHNNAPSIDMGAKNTVVNFNGGQVELQNAQIVSTNYISSMAICQRAGTFAGIFLAYGMGTDGVGGTVNFNDGTTTVLTMEVDANYRQYYLMDTDASGNELTTTSCLRTPANTFVKGGSHCMMRACTEPTSKGGAPKDKPGNDGKLLGLYKFPKNPASGKKGGWTEGENGLVIPANGNVPDNYSVESVTPNTNGTANNATDDFLNFWFDPDFEPSAQPEIDMPITFWKTCMTQIAAQYGGHGGSVGGNTSVAMAGDMQNEEVVNLMYCKIDEYIHTEISKDSYQAPVKNPAHVGEAYLPVHPSTVGAATEHYITNEKPFQVDGKVYYITTATADVWNAFTAPFNVANIYIMETYPEKLLKDMEDKTINDKQMKRIDIIKEQAKHNADFAAFFAVTVALGQQKDFETIYREYIDWAKLQDKASGAWDGRGTYTLRGKSALVPYDGTNWATADFYLNENAGPWEWEDAEKREDGHFTTTWQIPDASDGILLHQGKTYSMLLPFCTRCGEDIDSREFWDYWSGKFLIFESTDGPHTINGSDVFDEDNETDGIFATQPAEGQALLKGNSSFAQMQTLNSDLYTFMGDLQHSTFYAIEFESDDLNGDVPKAIAPTESFLLPNIPVPSNMRLRGVTTSGQVIYDTNGDGTVTGGHLPTVGGGNDLFITSTAEGINIAVAQPQQVRVMSATGAIIYSGMVQTAVDVTLPTTGVYVVAGENEVHKILY